MKNCIHLVKRKNKPFCKKDDENISFEKCKSCTNKEYKQYKTLQAKTELKRSDKPIKTYSKKRAKLEKSRFSVFTDNLEKCIECDKPKQDLHECIGGANRQNSMFYGLVIPVCRSCHDNAEVRRKWVLKAQKKFVEMYGYEKFMEIFKQDFKVKYKKGIK